MVDRQFEHERPVEDADKDSTVAAEGALRTDAHADADANADADVEAEWSDASSEAYEADDEHVATGYEHAQIDVQPDRDAAQTEAQVQETNGPDTGIAPLVDDEDTANVSTPEIHLGPLGDLPVQTIPAAEPPVADETEQRVSPLRPVPSRSPVHIQSTTTSPDGAAQQPVDSPIPSGADDLPRMLSIPAETTLCPSPIKRSTSAPPEETLPQEARTLSLIHI